MAKMGYRHGSGLGRDEQGMSMALQVEKTSRRGGKILHERDIATKGNNRPMRLQQISILYGCLPTVDGPSCGFLSSHNTYHIISMSSYN